MTSIAETKLNLLEAAGVDNWGWYDEAISSYEELQCLPEGYELSAEETLDALECGGVDNWEWYGEALAGFSDYEDYVNEEQAKGNTTYLEFYDWQAREEEQENEVKVDEVVEPTLPREIKFPEIISLLETEFPELSEDDRKSIYFDLIDKHNILSRNTFTKEFEDAIKFAGSDDALAKDFLANASSHLIATIIKNGKLLTYIKVNELVKDTQKM